MKTSESLKVLKSPVEVPSYALEGNEIYPLPTFITREIPPGAAEMSPSDASEPVLSRIEQALRGLLAVDDLDGDEQEEFFDRFSVKMGESSPEEEAFFAERERLGLGVGLDEAGNWSESPNRRIP